MAFALQVIEASGGGRERCALNCPTASLTVPLRTQCSRTNFVDVEDRIPTKDAMEISDQTFDNWVHEYNRLLFGLAYWWTGSRTDAEKLTQEAFFQMFAHIENCPGCASIFAGLSQRDNQLRKTFASAPESAHL